MTEYAAGLHLGCIGTAAAEQAAFAMAGQGPGEVLPKAAGARRASLGSFCFVLRCLNHDVENRNGKSLI
jgi:hypothetical protein